ncbi:MAG: hypothetical protein AMXMBFR61_02400 [Fimbriimonadales bacterium]
MARSGTTKDSERLAYRGYGTGLWKEQWGVRTGRRDSVGEASEVLEEPNPYPVALSRKGYEPDGDGNEVTTMDRLGPAQTLGEVRVRIGCSSHADYPRSGSSPTRLELRARCRRGRKDSVGGVVASAASTDAGEGVGQPAGYQRSRQDLRTGPDIA